MRDKIILIFIILIGIAIIFSVQFALPTLFSADGYLHIRMAKFLRQYGPYYNFRWARFSIFATNFADKDFLYHVLLVPFSFSPNIFWAAKLSAAICASALYMLFWIVLKRYCKIKAIIPLFLLAFLGSAPFLQALSQPRNMVLIIGLTLVFVHSLIQKRAYYLFAISVLYGLSHVSSPYLLLFVLMAELVRFINEKVFWWRSLVATGIGVLLAFLTHPHFPNNFLVFYLNGIQVPIFALKWGLELGAEFFPLNTRDLVLGYPFILLAVILLLAMGLSRARQISIATKIWFCIAGFFFIFSFFSQRYLIHAYPLILIAWASYISDWWQVQVLPTNLKNNPLFISLIVLVMAAVFLPIGIHTYKDLRQRLQSELIYNQHYERIGKWMSEHIPPGEVIFHTNWSDSQYFIGLNPQDDYMVTLDPIYMYYWSPAIYNMYRQIAFGNNAEPYTLLKKVFGVRYGYAGKNYFSGFIQQVKSDSRFEILVEDALGIIFRLR
ncbi:MAG: hypothetical protein NC908_02600 [Candidatus Omnitrophica bacterium]|nr:hypothetical protein [Candidatus Omnitrophota bacterium]